MLNGQLQLTDLTMGVSMTRLRRPGIVAGVLSLAILAGCASGTRAPVVDMTGGQPTASAQPGGSYVVKPGDTLYKIARANNVDIENVKRWNNLSDPNQISVGQVLKMSGSSGGGAAQPAPIASTKAQPRPLDQPADTSATATASLPPPTTTPPPVDTKPATRAADAGVINWAWPAGGQIMQGFNNNSKGIDIAGAPGDPVTAAADGKVMYSGNGVRGLGNLIIVNHQNGFITAYAHNRTLLVKTGQDVKRGAKIAEIGQSDTTSPRLHFEIRRQGTPVDPMQYLPAK